MDAIEQLKSDIEVLTRVGRTGGYASGYAVDPLLAQMKAKLKKLEEDANDPHKNAKSTVMHWDITPNTEQDKREVVDYVKSLAFQLTLSKQQHLKLEHYLHSTMPRVTIKQEQQ